MNVLLLNGAAADRTNAAELRGAPDTAHGAGYLLPVPDAELVRGASLARATHQNQASGAGR